MEKMNRSELMSEFSACVARAFKISILLGIPNPFDKSKWREMIWAAKYSMDLFKGASGGKKNDETYGADGISTEKTGIIPAGRKNELKTATMTDVHREKYERGTLKKQYSMVYNGAYDFVSIDRYKDTTHWLSLFNGADKVVSVIVPTSYVIEQLTKNLKYDNERRSRGENVTTNCNSVKVQFVNSVPLIGEII
jgi:hypothetical protein